MDLRKSVALELAAIGTATLLFVATFRVRPPYLDFALAAAAVALIVSSARRSTSLWKAAKPGALAPRSRRAAWLASAVFTAAALVVLAAIGRSSVAREAAAETPSWHFFVAIALYFPWALLQQYIFQFYLLSRLLQLLPAGASIAITALAFSSVHFPRWPVMIAVALAGAVWSSIYYRWRTLLPIAASHALLGAALHYWIFGNDLVALWTSRVP